MKGLDKAICPGCATVYTRDQIARAIREHPTHCFTCECGCCHNSPPYRPLTVQEIIDGKRADGSYHDVALEKFAIVLLDLYHGSHKCNCGDLAEYEHLRDKRRKSKKDLKWIAERLKERLGHGRRAEEFGNRFANGPNAIESESNKCKK